MNIASRAIRARSFDAWADDYEQYRPGYPVELFDLIADRLELTPDAEVVDLGAGTGKVARAIAKRGWRTTAVDPGEPMLDVLRRHAAQEGLVIEVVPALAEETGLPSAAFDAALVGEAYHWFDAPSALGEMARIVRAGGGIAFFWNVGDERVPLVAAEGRLAAEYGIDGSDVRRTGPLPATRDAIRAVGAFEEPQFVQVPHSVPMTGADYLGLAKTKSHLRTAPPELQKRYVGAFEEMLASHGIGSSDPMVAPYVVDCWIAKRRAA